MTQERGHWDAIVVGSGFGGAVCAARLAERGLRLLLLERGPWWGPLQSKRGNAARAYPRGPRNAARWVRNVRLSRQGRRREWLLNPDGLLEVHGFEHLKVLTSSGVGGGSHIYTSILQQPHDRFYQALPPEITPSELQPYFDRVRRMLRPAPAPEWPEKTRAFAAAAQACGLAAEAPELAVVWPHADTRGQPSLNAAGVRQWPSTGRSDVLVGCEDGSKTTLDLTYVPLALRHGAQVRALCEVLEIGGQEHGYWVRYRDHSSGQLNEVAAPRLVLAAGGLNTQRLLFQARDRQRTLAAVSKALGHRFSPNGDAASLLWRSARLTDTSEGPSIGALVRIQRDASMHYQIGEVGIPADALPVPEVLRRALRRSAFLFAMGSDGGEGQLQFDGVGLTSSVGRSIDARLYDEIAGTLRQISRHYDCRRVIHDLFAARPHGLATVHPLGGCAIGSDPSTAVVNHAGEVFGHPGLFVADGSLYPRAPGVAPSLTIAALAERQADWIVARG